MVNDLPMGRYIDNMLRMVNTLQFNQTHGEVSPAGWQRRQLGMTDKPEGGTGCLAGHAVAL